MDLTWSTSEYPTVFGIDVSSAVHVADNGDTTMGISDDAGTLSMETKTYLGAPVGDDQLVHETTIKLGDQGWRMRKYAGPAANPPGWCTVEHLDGATWVLKSTVMDD